jgi:hypothetical protein
MDMRRLARLLSGRRVATTIRTADLRLQVRATLRGGATGSELEIEVVNTGAADVVIDIPQVVIVRADPFAGLLRNVPKRLKPIPVLFAGDQLPCRVPPGTVKSWIAPMERVVHRLGRTVEARDLAPVVVRPAGGRQYAVRVRKA